MDIESFMPTEMECYRALREMKWPEGVKCVRCGSEEVMKTGRWRNTPNQRYHCKGCGAWFNDRTETIFQDSKLPLRVWFFAAFLMQFKVSVLEISRTLELTYWTVFKMVKKLRSSVYTKTMGTKLCGVVEMDEVYVKAGLKGKSGLKRESRKRGLKSRGRGTYNSDKVPVVAVVERESGRVRIQPQRNLKGRVVIKRYRRDVDPEAKVYTDEFRGYNTLPADKHESVNHGNHEYSNGNGVHINTAEAEFSVYRPWMATYRGVSKEKVYLYAGHYEFLQNNREMHPVNRMLAMVKFLRTNLGLRDNPWFYDKNFHNN